MPSAPVLEPNPEPVVPSEELFQELRGRETSLSLFLYGEDSVTTHQFSLALVDKGFNTVRTSDDTEAFDLLKVYDYDLAILLCQKEQGYKLLSRIRQQKLTMPIIVLNSHIGWHRELVPRAFSLGADDYMSGRIDIRELVARIYAVVRRNNSHTGQTIQAGNIRLNLTTKSVARGTRHVYLTRSEYCLFELLMLRQGKVVTKPMIFNALYGHEDPPEPKIIDVFVHKLRMKLNPKGPHDKTIRTVWGRGYIIPTNEELEKESSDE